MVENLAQFCDQRVIVIYNLPEPNEDGHTAEEVEGLVVTANDSVGIVIKPAGKTLVRLIKTVDIEKIDLAPTSLRVFKQKTMRVIGLDTVRQHLLDRHGWSLSVINGMDENKAMEIHKGIDHANLGHAHGLVIDGAE